MVLQTMMMATSVPALSATQCLVVPATDRRYDTPWMQRSPTAVPSSADCSPDMPCMPSLSAAALTSPADCSPGAAWLSRLSAAAMTKMQQSTTPVELSAFPPVRCMGVAMAMAEVMSVEHCSHLPLPSPEHQRISGPEMPSKAQLSKRPPGRVAGTSGGADLPSASPAACCSRSVFGRVASTRLGADFVSATSSHDAAWQLATDVRAVDFVVTAWWAVAVTRGSLAGLLSVVAMATVATDLYCAFTASHTSSAFGVVTATVAADSPVTSVSLLVGLLSGPFNKRGCSGGLEQSRWSVRRSGEHSEPAAATMKVRRLPAAAGQSSSARKRMRQGLWGPPKGHRSKTTPLSTNRTKERPPAPSPRRCGQSYRGQSYRGVAVLTHSTAYCRTIWYWYY